MNRTRQNPNAITELNKHSLTLIRQEIDAALKDIGIKYNLDFSAGNARYNELDATYKLKVALRGIHQEDSGVSGKELEWRRNAIMFSMEPEDFGKTFEFNGSVYTICGCKPKSPKYNVLAKNNLGKTYKFSAMSIKDRVAA